MGLKSTITKSNTSKLIEQKMLYDYKYDIGTVKQAGNYNKKTNYLSLHIWKTYKTGRDIANMIENQEPFNSNSSAPKLKILTTVEAADASPEVKLEIKHENDQYKIKYKAEYCISSEKVIITQVWVKHMHSYLGNAQQAYSIE